MCRQALAEELGVEPGLETVELTAVHAILTGRVEAATALAELETRLVEITGFRVGSPR